MIDRKIEILAPAGSFDSLRAAVAAGADAVYLGGARFGARAYAKNFTETEMEEAIDFAHIHGRRVYLTVNTLFKNGELDELYSYLLPYYQGGLDGVIVQDLGAADRIREWFPQMELHASTQMTITQTAGAELLKKRGFVRIVPARELNLSEIRHMKEETGLEIECFVHGALCYCYSGQCLLSSMIGGRSGNRGQCAQPCRLSYSVNDRKPAEILSLKDLSTIDMLPQLIDAGIDSFKIEGRMKQPDYVYTVTEIYRKYTDLYLAGEKPYHVDPNDRNRLMAAYRRRGYTDGYYNRHNGKEMISSGRMDAREESSNEVRYKTQEEISGRMTLAPGKPIRLSLEYKDIQCVCEGVCPEPAKNQPLTLERVRRQMEKTGNSDFVFRHLTVDMQGELFLPMQAVNELRRQGLQQIKEQILDSYRRTGPGCDGTLTSQIAETDERTEKIRLAALVQNLEQLRCLEENRMITRFYIESEAMEDVNLISHLEKYQGLREYFLAMPFIFRESVQHRYEKSYPLIERIFDGILVRNLESIGWLKRHGYQKPVRTDANVYAFNCRSKAVIREMGTEGITAPAELNRGELRNLGMESAAMVVYGHQPVMISANCVRKTTEGCSHKSGWLWIKDRYQKKFAVKNCCEYCYNVIYNTAPLYLADLADEVSGLNPQEVRMDFTTESPKEAAKIAERYKDAFLLGVPAGLTSGDFTRGHYKRGVK